jgi:hypothetical protein
MIALLRLIQVIRNIYYSLSVLSIDDKIKIFIFFRLLAARFQKDKLIVCTYLVISILNKWFSDSNYLIVNMRVTCELKYYDYFTRQQMVLYIIFKILNETNLWVSFKSITKLYMLLRSLAWLRKLDRGVHYARSESDSDGYYFM